MHTFILISLYYVLFHPYFINGQEIELSFNTPVYEGTNDYYAHMGEDVVLTCTVRSAQALVYMERGSRSSATHERFVENGEPVGDLLNQIDKYSFQSINGRYQLTIHNLEETDSLHYGCGFCSFIHSSKPTVCSQPLVVFLEVKATSDTSPIPDFCDLIDNADGIFFTGNDLSLRCPKLPFKLVAFNGIFSFSVDFEMEDYSDTFSLLTVKSLTPRFNETMLSCISVENGDVNNDYCRHFPTILVFHEIKILLSGGEREITNGENVTLTCHSYPFLPFTIHWDILDSNVRFENIHISELDQGSSITFTDLKFLDSSSSRLTVFCNVTIGSESNVRMASIYPRMQAVSSTHVTFIESTTPFMKPSTYVSPAIIVIPTTVAFIALGIVIAGLIYMKVRKSEKKEELDSKKVNMKKDVKTLDESPCYIEVINEAEKGLEGYCAAQNEWRRQVEGSSYYKVGNNVTTIELGSPFASHIPTDGVYERTLPAIHT